jgi:hypothetical protein
MARYEATVHGNLKELKNYILKNRVRLGETITVEEESEGMVDGVGYYVAGLERYSVLGQSRVSLNLMMLEYSEGVRVVATSLGRSTAMFVKINHWGEDNFLSAFVTLLKEYERKSSR